MFWDIQTIQKGFSSIIPFINVYPFSGPMLLDLLVFLIVIFIYQKGGPEKAFWSINAIVPTAIILQIVLFGKSVSLTTLATYISPLVLLWIIGVVIFSRIVSKL